MAFKTYAETCVMLGCDVERAWAEAELAVLDKKIVAIC